jgi:hypothetical protein
MPEQLVQLAYEVELKPGEKLALPAKLSETIGPGRWLITVQQVSAAGERVRDHAAFLRSYAPEDEGLYDDYPAR